MPRSRRTTADEERPRWLTPAEFETWYSLMLLLAVLPLELETQLQRDSQLSFVEYHVLAALSDAPDHSRRMSELAVLTQAELSRLSHLMSRLETRGLVRRVTDPDDRRCTRAVLTADGYAYLAAAAPGHVRRVRELVFDVLDHKQQEALRQAATTVTSRLRDTGNYPRPAEFRAPSDSQPRTPPRARRKQAGTARADCGSARAD